MKIAVKISAFVFTFITFSGATSQAQFDKIFQGVLGAAIQQGLQKQRPAPQPLYPSQHAPRQAYSPSGQGPSFSCRGRRTAVEQAICNDPKLSQLDRNMADAFIARMQQGANLENLRARQAQWRAQRDMCTNRECLKQSMIARTEQLGGAPADLGFDQQGGFTASKELANGSSGGIELPQLPSFKNKPLIGANGPDHEEVKWLLLVGLAVDPDLIARDPEGFASVFLSKQNPLSQNPAWHSSNEFHAADSRREFMAEYAPLIKAAAPHLPLRLMYMEHIRFGQYDPDRHGFTLNTVQDGTPRVLNGVRVPISGEFSPTTDFWQIPEAGARGLFETSPELASHQVSILTEVELTTSIDQPGTLIGRSLHSYLVDPQSKQVIQDLGASPNQAATEKPVTDNPLAFTPTSNASNPFADWTHPPNGFRVWHLSRLDGAVQFSDVKLLMLLLAAANRSDFFHKSDSYGRSYYLEQAMLDGATMNAIFAAGGNFRGLDQFEKGRSAAKLQALLPKLTSMAPRLPFDVTLVHHTSVPEYNMSKGGFPIQVAEDFGLKTAAAESGLSLTTAFAWPDLFWPVDAQHAEQIWKSLGTERMVDVAGHVTFESIDAGTGQVTVKLHSVSVYKRGTQKLLYSFPVASDALSQSEHPSRLVASRPLPMDKLLLCAELFTIPAPIEDRLVTECRDTLARRDADTYTNPSRLAALSPTDPAYPFYPRGGLPPNTDVMAKLREWGKAYAAAAAAGPVQYSDSRMYERANGGMTYFAAAKPDSVNGEQWSRVLEKLQLRPEQITSAGQIESLNVVFLIPNLASAYTLFVPNSQLNHDSDGGSTPFANLRIERAEFLQDNSNKNYLALDVRPIDISVVSRTNGGGVLATRSFADVQDFGKGPIGRTASDIVPFNSALIDLLVAKASGSSLPREAVAYMLKRRWEYEHEDTAPIDRYFQISRPFPSVDAIAAQTDDFVTWAAVHAPELPVKVRLATSDEMPRSSTIIPWRSFQCVEAGPSYLKANEYSTRAHYEQLQCERRKDSMTSDEQASCEQIGQLVSKSALLEEIGGVCRRTDVKFSFPDPLSVFARFDKELPAPIIDALGGKETVKVTTTLTLIDVTGLKDDPRETLFADAPAAIRADSHNVDEHYFASLSFRTDATSYSDARTGAPLQARSAFEPAAPTPAAIPVKPETIMVLPVASEGSGPDVLGIRLGMDFGSAEALIRNHMTVGTVLDGIRAYDEQAKQGFIKPMTSGRLFVSEDQKEMIALIDEPPAMKERVVALWRRVYIPDGTISAEEITQDMTKKYGEPLQYPAHPEFDHVHWSTPSGRQCSSFYGNTNTPTLSQYWFNPGGQPADLHSTNPRGMNSPTLLGALFDPLNPNNAQWKRCGPYITMSFLNSRGLSGPNDELDVTLTDFGRYADAYALSRKQMQNQNPAVQAHIKF